MAFNALDFISGIASGLAGVPTVRASSIGSPSGVSTELENILNEEVQSPSQASLVPDIGINQPVEDYSDMNYLDQYLAMLKKGAEVGLFSTAQDAVNEAQKDRAFQALEAEKTRQWYEDMSNTSFQRQVSDLEAAGLNPILGWAHSGVGAASAMPASPTGRSTNIASQAPSLSDYINAGANLLNSASNLMQYFIPKLFSGTNTNLSEILSKANNVSHVFVHK